MTDALLLAHGSGGSVRGNFGALVAGLSERIATYGVDFPGSGDTPCADRPLEVDDLADRLVAAAPEGSRIVIVGFSMGCAVAVCAALRHPARVDGLVLTAGSPYADAVTRQRLARWQELIHGAPEELARYTVSVMFSAAFLESLTATQCEILEELAGLGLPPGTPDQLELVERLDVRRDLPQIRVPTLVIGTTLDRLVTPTSMRGYVDGIQDARWAELKSGHAIAMESPREWQDHIVEFLDRLPARAAAGRATG